MADFNRIAESDLVKMAIAMIVGGALVTIVAFVGCLGAMRESYKLLMTVGFYETLGESYMKWYWLISYIIRIKNKVIMRVVRSQN